MKCKTSKSFQIASLLQLPSFYKKTMDPYSLEIVGNRRRQYKTVKIQYIVSSNAPGPSFDHNFLYLFIFLLFPAIINSTFLSDFPHSNIELDEW